MSQCLSSGEPELVDWVACRSGTNTHKEMNQVPQCDSRCSAHVEDSILVKNPVRLFPGLNKLEKCRKNSFTERGKEMSFDMPAKPLYIA